MSAAARTGAQHGGDAAGRTGFDALQAQERSRIAALPDDHSRMHSAAGPQPPSLPGPQRPNAITALPPPVRLRPRSSYSPAPPTPPEHPQHPSQRTPPQQPGNADGGASPAANRLSAAALSAAIRDAATLDELAALYDGLRDSFRSGHVSAALSRLPHAAELAHTSTPRLTQPQHEALLAGLLEAFETHRAAGAYGPRELSACAWVLGKLGRTERWPLVAELAQSMLAARRQQREQARRLQKAARTAWLEQRRREWAAEQPPEDGAAGVEHATSSGDPAASRAVPEPLLPACCALDLSNMALGMAKTGCVVPRRWKQLTAAAGEQLKEFGAQELVNFAWSLAQAHRKYRRSRCDRDSQPGGAAGDSDDGDDAAAAGLQTATAATPAAGGAETEAVSSGIPELGSLEPALHRDWRPWLGEFVEDVLAPRLRALLRRCSGQQVANAAWALTTLGHADGRTLTAVAAEAEARAGGLTPRGICQLTWALATMVHTANARKGPVSDTSGGSHEATPAEAVAVPLDALRALALAAVRRIRSFSGQGLANLLWGLRPLGLRVRRRVLAAAAREAVLRLDELKPLALATLVGEWAAAALYHPALFAAVVPAALARLREFRPPTLARLLAAYARVGHADRRLFQAAAAALLAAAPPVARSAAAAAPQGYSSPAACSGSGSELHPSHEPGVRFSCGLDYLSPSELCELVLAYGHAGVHVPRLMDELLARLAPSLTPPAGAPDGARLPARAACRLACALAALGHSTAAAATMPSDGGGAGGRTDAAEAAAAGANASLALCALRLPALAGLHSLDPPSAVAAVHALMRLGVLGPPVAARVTEALCHRFAPGARGFAAALPAIARSPTLGSDPRVVSRLVWIVGRSAAAALAEAGPQLLHHAGASGDSRGGKAVIAAAGVELARGLLAMAEVLLEERTQSLHGEELAALAEALAAVLAVSHGGSGDGGSSKRAGSPGSSGGLLASQDVLYGALLRVAEVAFRRAAAGPGAPAVAVPAAAAGVAVGTRTAHSQPPSALSPRHLVTIVHAMCDSGVTARQPLVRAAAARQVLATLEAAIAPPSRAHATGAIPSAQTRTWPGGVRARLSRMQLGLRLSEDAVARLLAAAARLQLYDQPAALPTLQGAARWLAWRLSASGAPPTAPGMAPLGLHALQDLLQYCRPSDLPQIGGSLGSDARAARLLTRAGGGRSCGREPSPLLASVYRWAVRQALLVLPWLSAELRDQALADAEAVGAMPVRSLRTEVPAAAAVSSSQPRAPLEANSAHAPQTDKGVGSAVVGSGVDAEDQELRCRDMAVSQARLAVVLPGVVAEQAVALAQQAVTSVRRVRVEKPANVHGLRRLRESSPDLWVAGVAVPECQHNPGLLSYREAGAGRIAVAL